MYLGGQKKSNIPMFNVNSSASCVTSVNYSMTHVSISCICRISLWITKMKTNEVMIINKKTSSNLKDDQNFKTVTQIIP